MSKISISLSALLISVFAWLPQADRFRPSIFTYLPPFVYGGGVLLVALSVSTCIYYLCKTESGNALVATIPLLTLVAVFPMLPYRLGYIGKYGDNISHIGAVYDIFATGMIPSVIYPALHILAATLSYFTAVDPAASITVLSVVVHICFFIILVLLARCANVPAAAVILFAPLAVPAVQVVPSTYTYLVLFPLASYLLLQWTSGSQRWTPAQFVVLFGVVMLALWPSHIIPAFVIVLIAVLVSAEQGLSRLWYRHDFGYVFQRSVGNNLTITLPKQHNALLTRQVALAGLTGFLWASATVLFERGTIILSTLFVPRSTRAQNLDPSVVQDTLVSEFGFSLRDIVWLGLKNYGDFLFVCVAAGAGVVACLGISSAIARRDGITPQHLPLAIAILVVYCGLWSAFEAVVGLVPSLNFVRALRPILFLGIISSGVALYTVIRVIRLLIASKGSSVVRSVLALVVSLAICCAMVSGTLLSFNNNYDNPSVLGTNRQFLPSDVDGMDWYFEYKSQTVNTTTLWRSNDRYADLLLRPEERERRQNELNYLLETNKYRSPAHFGYPNNSTFGAAVGCRYYISGDYGQAVYLNAWGARGKFTEQDFARLAADPTVRDVYSNGNVNISIVSC